MKWKQAKQSASKQYHNSPRYIHSDPWIIRTPKSDSKTRTNLYYLHIIRTESFSFPSQKSRILRKQTGSGSAHKRRFFMFSAAFLECFFGLYTNILYKYGEHSCSFTYLLSIMRQNDSFIHEISEDLCLITGKTLLGSEEVKCCHLAAGLTKFPTHITTVFFTRLISRQSLTWDIWREKCRYIAGNYGNW